ncbi:MAG: glutamine amidotransferase [Candidatus Saccharimonas sp.]
MTKKIIVLQLYPRDMNIYGDWGNVLTIKRRLEWRGYEVDLREYNLGDTFPQDVDIIIGGGGQDSGQARIGEDLLTLGPTLKRLAEKDVPMLVICGLYQQFGHFFKTKDGHTIQGIGILDVETYGSDIRMIGNIVTHSDEFGDIVGYENHSGQTTLGPNATPLAKVILGAGNNDHDGHEGARYRNVIGSYLHGSLLPKNPEIADFLIGEAIKRKFDDVLVSLERETDYTDYAREIAMKRPR